MEPNRYSDLPAEAERCRKFKEQIQAEAAEDARKASQEPIAPKVRGMVEIARSFSYKLNVGNYESRDFFCSQKIECDASEAEALSEQVHEFCVRQVRHAVAAYMKAREEQRNADNR